MNLAILGLDTSHGPEFTKILIKSFPEHRLTGAWAGGSDTIPISHQRVAGFTQTVADLGVPIMDTPDRATQDADAVFILSLDANSHAPLLDSIARPGLRVFIDKPLAYNRKEAKGILSKARESGIDLFSSSALRFLPDVQNVLHKMGRNAIRKLQLRAPLNAIQGVPRYHFYGIHAVEVLVTQLGPQICRIARMSPTGEHFRLDWENGAVAELELAEEPATPFDLQLTDLSGKTYHFPNLTESYTPRYLPLLENCLKFFNTGEPPVPIDETLAVLDTLSQFEAQ